MSSIMNRTKYEDLLKDGFCAVRAKAYLQGLENERRAGLFDSDYIQWAQSNGFKAWTCKMYGLEMGDSLDEYLSDYDYHRSFPLNSWERIWVNDKLTLKLILNGTECSHLMPDYYYYSTPRGLMPLSDTPYGSSLTDFLACLKKIGKFACKPNNGARASGFYVLEYLDDCFYINNQKASEREIIDFVENNPNYLYTEYLLPDEFWASYSDKVHTIRINTLNAHGDAPAIVNSHVRIPTSNCRVSNRVNYETAEEANLYVQINHENGKMQNATLCFASRFEKIDKHPDTKAPLDSFANGYKECAEAALQVCHLLPNLEWLGFDFAVTNKGIKIMEINTHADHTVDQIGKPARLRRIIAAYFEKKLSDIDNMTEAQRRQRNAIQR